MITLIITILFSTSTTLCCHNHRDGSLGCWPSSGAATEECDMSIQCPNGAYQTDPDDEESWSCRPNPAPNS